MLRLQMLFLCLFTTTLLSGEIDEVFAYPQKTGRPMNIAGICDTWEHLAKATVGVASMPIWLNFNPRNLIEGGLPSGWLLPIVDSKAILTSESEALVLLPTGEIVKARKSAEGKWDSASEWKIVEEGRELKFSQKGMSIVFKEGMIASMKSENHFDLEWRRRQLDGHLSIYDRKAGAEIVQVRRIGRAVDQCLEIFTRQPATLTRISYDKPDLNVAGDYARHFNMKGAMHKIEFCEGNGTVIGEVKVSQGDTSIEWKSDKIMLNRAYSWNGDGTLARYGAQRFIVDQSHSKEHPEISTVRVDGSEPEILQSAVVKEGHKLFIYRKGNVQSSEYARIPGVGSRLRKESLLVDGQPKDMYRASFDTNGNIISDSRGDFHRVYKEGVFFLFEGKRKLYSY